MLVWFDCWLAIMKSAKDGGFLRSGADVVIHVENKAVTCRW